ncbi:MAG: aspartate kinase [archaeon]
MRIKTKQKRSRLVVKFGGSSLSSPGKISKAVQTVTQEMERGAQMTVVVSAMGRTTDSLLETISGTSSSNRSSDHVDDILSMGERTSARVFHAALSAQGVRSKCFDPREEDWPIITNDNFGDATPILTACQRLIRRQVTPCLRDRVIPVLPGFVGRTADGRVTTMGRGGSDITAFLLARCLPADESILVTDTDGLMTADPKLVDTARPIPEISIRQLIGLADSGTKFLKTKALRYLNGTFNVRITSNMAGSLRSSGTIIKGSLGEELTTELETPHPSAMVTITGENISQHPKILSEILSKVAHQKAKILGFSANSNSLIIYVHLKRKNRLVSDIHKSVLMHPEMKAMAVRDNLSLIKIVGVGLVQTPGLIASVSEPLRENRLNIYGIFTIASSISVVVDWQQRKKALQLVKKSLRRLHHD